MFANAFGEAVSPRIPVEFDHDSIERARDFAMLAMHRQGVPLRFIGQFFGLAKSTVWKRIQAIPDKAKRYGQSLV